MCVIENGNIWFMKSNLMTYKSMFGKLLQNVAQVHNKMVKILDYFSRHTLTIGKNWVHMN